MDHPHGDPIPGTVGAVFGTFAVLGPQALTTLVNAVTAIVVAVIAAIVAESARQILFPRARKDRDDAARLAQRVNDLESQIVSLAMDGRRPADAHKPNWTAGLTEEK